MKQKNSMLPVILRNGFIVALLLLTGYVEVFAQSKQVSGLVKDDAGKLIEGVTVAIKGSSQNALTNSKGEFTINVPSEKSVLVFSYVGMGRKEMVVGTNANLSVTMAYDDKSLDDVVVVGYGTQKRTHLTGAVSTVNVKDIEDLPLGSLAATLQGRMAGVAVSGGTSRPGSPAQIVIRNPMILSKDGGSLSPLYVIDNVIRSEEDFNTLDATEVENISVLKDAAAAIYGILGAQGVVVVTTKRGKAGKPKFSINSSVGFNDATMLPKMMDGYQLATYLNSSLAASKNFIADGSGGYVSSSSYYTPDELEHFRNNNYDWLDNAWKSSMVTRHAFNVSGGSDRATFFAGASYFYQNGNLDNISNDKWTFRASADIKIAKGLKVGLAVSGDVSSSHMYLLKQGGENPENDMKGLLYTPGYTPPYVDGYPVQLSSASNQNTIDAFHFFEVQRLNNYNDSRGNGMNILANIDYQVPFIKGLTAKVQYSKTLDNTYPKQFGTRYKVYKFSMLGEHSHIYGGDVISPAVTIQNGNRIYLKPSYADQYQLNGSITYTRKFGKHEITLLGVAEQAESIYSDVQTVTEDPTEGAPDNARFAFGAEDVFETEKETGRIAYVGRLNYNYSNKYLLEAAIRNDYSAKFAPEYRSAVFPSVSAGWVISEEGFFPQNFASISYFKLRGSFGMLGGDATKEWPYLERYTPLATGGPVFGGNNSRAVGTKNEQMPNRASQWDDVTKYNVGLDARFLKDRLSATVEYYYDHRYNMLTSLTASVPLTVGSAIAAENYSTINGQGYEISLGWKDNISRHTNYYINGFLTWSDATSVKVDVDKGFIGTYRDPTGKSTDMGVLGYHYIGMFRSQAEVDDFLSKNPDYKIFGKVPQPGMLYYQDVRGAKDPLTNQYAGPDGIIDENDQDWIAPKASNNYGFGLSLGVAWKGLRLDCVVSGAFGGQSSIEGAARKLGTSTSSRPDFWVDNWTPENPNAAYPNPYYNASYDVASSFWFKSSFSCRMRSLNLSYSLDSKLVNRIGFSGLKLYVTSTNPFNFYNPYSYKDNAAGSFDTYPTLKTIAFGLNASL